MKKIIISVFFVFLLASCSIDLNKDFAENYPVVYAHRGAWFGLCDQERDNPAFYIPENSLDAVRMAARLGYPALEIDVRWTADSVLVCMHDPTVNRTMRNLSDASPIREKRFVSDMTLEEIRSRYALDSTEPEMRRPIPTLEDMLRECAAVGVKPMLHCDIAEGYDVAVSILGEDFVAFGSKLKVFQYVRKISPNCDLLFDTGEELANRGVQPDYSAIESLLGEVGENIGTSSMKRMITDPDMIDALHAAAHKVQSSIFLQPDEAYAVRNGADILLSDFCWRPSEGMKPVSRMRLSSSKSDGGDSLSFSEDGIGALTMTVKGKGSCTVIVEETAENGAVRSYEYAFGAPGEDVLERLSYRFWRNDITVSLQSGEDSSFKLAASRYKF